MYQSDTNEYGCALYNQTGNAAVRDFDMIIARLSPELRTAFEAERAAQLAERECYSTTYAYTYYDTRLGLEDQIAHKAEAISLGAQIERGLREIERLGINTVLKYIFPFLPRY